MTFFVAPVVEGETEVICIEPLLHRIWNEVLARSERLQVVAPVRGSRPKFVKADDAELADKIREAVITLHGKSKRCPDRRLLVLIVFDADEDCPAQLAPAILQRAIAETSDSIACVLPKRTLENWFVAGASTLAGIAGLPESLPQRLGCEDSNGEAWLKAQIRSQNPRRTYKKTVDAKELARKMDLPECRRNSPSFDKLCRELEKHSASTGVERAEIDSPTEEP